MTTILEKPATATNPTPRVTGAPHLDWQAIDSVTNTVWLGRVRGAFVGMVEQRGEDGFAVTTRLGRSLGIFPTLEEAQDAFIRH
jgi:hypothetical protein